jgi:hypothetical protein
MNQEVVQEMLSEVQAMLAVLLDEYFKIDNPLTIDWEANTRDFCGDTQEDLEKFGHVMLDLHLYYQVDGIDYEPHTEYEEFPTLNHAYDYIVTKVLIKNGIDPDTLEPTS